ncbi:glutathione S-transferase theta-1-like isoform X1 [Diadema antillarum]|uniref:glutathione S-transferase theta-1-like isoform X1 n=1 Tax=Diadema antillarum TaxID=105358 RepID=UPI003A8421A0
MSVKIFYDLMSQPARTLVMFVRANKIPHTPCPIAMRKLEHQSEEYAKINPFKKIPAMQDGDFNLTESASILRYLHEKFDCTDHWYPRSLQHRARVNEYVDWQHINIRPYMTKIFLQDVIFPRMTGTPADPADLAPDVEKMEHTLDQFESYFLQDKPFLCGDDISIADLFAVNEVIQVEPTRYDTLEQRPRIKNWVGRVREKLTPELFDDVTKMIIKLKELKKSKL